MPNLDGPDLEWKATAIADLLAIIDYISDDNPDAAQVLKDEIEHKTSLLPERPQMGLANLFLQIRGLRELGPSRPHFEGIVFPEIEGIGSGVAV